MEPWGGFWIWGRGLGRVLLCSVVLALGSRLSGQGYALADTLP